jgi:hypothetical protein
MNRNSTFLRCFQSHAKSSPLLHALLPDGPLLAELEKVVHEHHRRENNHSSFVLRGKIDEQDEDLFTTIRSTVQHVVGHDAADSICGVRFLTTDLVQVKCINRHQCQRITRRRLAFSSIDTTPHPSAEVRRVLRTKLYVDSYCTKEQLRVRRSKWPLFQELKGKGLRPYFEGEQLYYYPDGTKRVVVHTENPSTAQHAAASPKQLHSVDQPAAVQATQQQQEQPRAEQQGGPQSVQERAGVERAVEQPLLQHVEAVAEPPTQQPPASTTPTTSAPATGPSAGPAEREGPATPAPSGVPAASASAVTAVTAPASKGVVDQQAPRHNKSKKTRPAVPNPTTQRTARPPLRSISNTAPRNASTKPAWGARSPPDPPYGAYLSVGKPLRIPHMLPNGQVAFYT